MKVAVAVGCLKSKPAGVSGREYAQQLCDRFQRGQLMWKKRYERAETEILHLKQQLDLQQNHTAENMEVAVADDGLLSSHSPIFLPLIKGKTTLINNVFRQMT